MHIHLLISFPWIKTLHRRGEGSDQQNVPIILCDVFHLFSVQIECYVPTQGTCSFQINKAFDWTCILPT